jgi:rfaE bifunctional protein kinase chain/domain
VIELKIIQDTLSKFSTKNILVIGDLMLDEYVYGQVDRISPEAPVPVLNISNKKYCLGGAANVALNIHALQAKVFLFGMVGSDDAGKEILQLAQKSSLNIQGVYTSTYRRTTVKTRFISNNQQLLRADTEDLTDLNETELNFFQLALKNIFEKERIDGVIIEDYDKGCLTPFFIRYIIDLCHTKNVFIAVDPKRNHFFDYAGVSLFKPNLKELCEGLHHSFSSNTVDLINASLLLNEKMPVEHILITLSKHGVFYTDHATSDIIPAFVRSISDVSGAGDTVISIATLAMISGLSINEASWLANLAGGMVCEKPGVDVISLDELISEVKQIA